MTMRIAALLALLTLAAPAHVSAQEAQGGVNPQTAVTTASADCKTKNVLAVPLAVYLTPQGVFPAVPDQFGAAAHACVGSAPVAPSTQPFTAGYPYPGSWWTTGAYPYPLPLYHGP